MARYTSQAAVEAIGNRYDLVLIAAIRAREHYKNRSYKKLSTSGPVVTALREIEDGKVNRDYLKKIQKNK